jgi:hypothetical protein
MDFQVEIYFFIKFCKLSPRLWRKVFTWINLIWKLLEKTADAQGQKTLKQDPALFETTKNPLKFEQLK